MWTRIPILLLKKSKVSNSDRQGNLFPATETVVAAGTITVLYCTGELICVHSKPVGKVTGGSGCCAPLVKSISYQVVLNLGVTLVLKIARSQNIDQFFSKCI